MKGWDERPLRAYSEIRLGRQRSPENSEGPHMIQYVRAANVNDGTLDLSDVKVMNFTPEEQAVFSLRSGDVLVTEGSGSLSSVGASTVWREELSGVVCFQNTLIRLRPRSDRTDGRFLGWWARHAFGDGLFAAIATGANIHHVSAERVRDLRMRFPPLDIQRAIADFLDAETTRIDAVIAKKRRMMTLLEERFESAVLYTIAGKVTNAEGWRDSGLAWLGSIPDHWGVPWVGANFQTQLGKMLNASAASGPEQYPYLRNTNVQWDSFDLENLATMSFTVEERGRCGLQRGDLLVCEGGEVGRAAVWTGEPRGLYFQKAIHRVRPLGNDSTRFLMYCLWAAASREVFMVEGNQSTIVHLTGEKLREHRFPMPPRAEQDRIVRHLDRTQAVTSAVRSKLRRQIDLLAERRHALITAAVTGELDMAEAIAEEAS